MTKHETFTAAISAADVSPITPRVGAEIRNLRLSGDLSADVVADISALLLRHKVLFFRGQTHLDDAEQERFALRLGPLARIRRRPSSRALPQFWSWIPAGGAVGRTNGILT